MQTRNIYTLNSALTELRLDCGPGLYAFSARGNFGSGAVVLSWSNDGTNDVAIVDGSLTADGAFQVVIPGVEAVVTLEDSSGSVDVSLTRIA